MHVLPLRMYLLIKGWFRNTISTYLPSCPHTTTLKSTPVAAIFVSALSCGTKLKASEKSIIIVSVLTPSSSESAISCQTVTTCLSH